MATILDESQETLREERVYVPLTDTERTRRLRPLLPPRYEGAVVLPLSPLIRWGGIVAGVVVALAVVLLCTVLGTALGLSVLDTTLVLNVATLQDFTIPAGIWTGGIILIAY